MDKTSVQSRKEATAEEVPAERRRPEPGSGGAGTATRDAILRAARTRLIETGYAHLNVRDIAREAGVNHALIGYHFHGKQQLVLAVIDQANRELLDRQDGAGKLPARERREARALTQLVDMLSLMRLRAEAAKRRVAT